MDPGMGQNVSTPPLSPVPMIEVTVKFVMAGKSVIKVRVPAVCTVRGLKAIIAEKSEIFPEKQLLLYNDNELRDDDSRISNYGMVADCQVTMSVNMNTGVRKTNGPSGGSSVIFYVPVSLPEKSSGLRSTLKTLTTVKGKRENRLKRVEKTQDNAQIWTPEKHLEIELTRNRMKALMRKKNKTKIMSPATGTPIDGGSVISSRAHSPTLTPPNELSQHQSPTSSSRVSTVTDKETEVTDKELKLFFEPMESIEQLRRLHREKSLAPPPQNLEELEELKKKMTLVEKTTCKTCGKKIPPAEQAMRCRCKMLFCKKHRDPKSHLCKIDYKQTGRKKMNKWMQKVGDGGARKGKLV